MEMNTLSLLMPALQSKAMLSQPGKEQPSAGFAKLLALLQQLPGMGPKEAMVALQLAGPAEQAAALPKLFAALLPQLLSAGSSPPSEQEKEGVVSVASALPAVSVGLPLQSLALAAGGASSKAGLSAVAFLQPGSVLQNVVTADVGGEKLLPESLPAAVLQPVAAADVGGEKLLPESLPAAVLQAAAAAEGVMEKLLPEASLAAVPQVVVDGGVAELQSELLPARENHGAADRPGGAAKLESEKVAQLLSQTPEKGVPDLPSSRPLQPESPPTAQGVQALGYQVLSARGSLPAAVAQFIQPQVRQEVVAEQVLEKMVFNRELNGDSTLLVRLKPASLGEVQINLRLEDGRLTARIMTENFYVKEALDSALAQVKQRLEAQHIQVAELTVTVGGQQDFRQDRTFTPFWQQGNEMGKPRATATAEKGAVQPASLLQGLVDARV